MMQTHMVHPIADIGRLLMAVLILKADTLVRNLAEHMLLLSSTVLSSTVVRDILTKCLLLSSTEVLLST